MQINATSIIPHPIDRVYRAYRDELVAVAAYMPNVKEVIVRKRDDVADGVKLHNEWVGKGEIPKVAQSVIKPEMVRWDDYAHWHDGETFCDWKIQTRVFTENVRCFGTTRLTSEGPDRTKVALHGTLDLSLKDIPGVPRILAGTIAPQIEKFIVALITPNLEQTNTALARYLDAKG